MAEIWQLSAAQVAAMVRNKDISATEAAVAAIDRLAAVNHGINAVVTHRPDEVLRQAAATDAAIANGESPGLLAGVPVTVKVNIDLLGFATTNGTVHQREWIAKADSPVVSNL